MSGYNHVEFYQREDGKFAWRVQAGNNRIISTDGGQGYENENDCLAGFFGQFFGTWDESFLEMYQRWVDQGGQQYEVPPEAQEGAPVHVQSAPDGYPEDHARQDEELIDDWNKST